MSRKIILSVLLMLSLLLISACGGAQQSTQPTTAPTTAPSGAATTAPAGEATAVPTGETTTAPTGEATTEEPTSTEPISVSVTSGLDTLESYTVDFTMDFEGTKADGTAESGTMTMLMSVNNTTKDQYIKMDMTSTESGDQAFSVEMYQIGEDAYMLMDMGGTGEATCMKSPADAAQQGTPSISDMVGDVDGATLVKKGEDVNGITADHYTIDDVSSVFADADLEEGTVTVEKADVWIAQDEGYVVKMDIQASGKDTEGAEGSFTMTYTVKDVNAVDTIELPAACENAMEIPGGPGGSGVPGGPGGSGVPGGPGGSGVPGGTEGTPAP